ncbi:MAG: hypothetical protein EAZ47_00490 [Bacteroidetes bacterium]|nr:MAG: hypothetical protein EAZ47_00490 [Bacteroidota bacterium]
MFLFYQEKRKGRKNEKSFVHEISPSLHDGRYDKPNRRHFHILRKAMKEKSHQKNNGIIVPSSIGRWFMRYLPRYTMVDMTNQIDVISGNAKQSSKTKKFAQV